VESVREPVVADMAGQHGFLLAGGAGDGAGGRVVLAGFGVGVAVLVVVELAKCPGRQDRAPGPAGQETHGASGGPGFSLVIMGLSTFPGIPLGLGFELNRAGTLVAVNRRLDTNAVSEAVVAGRLESLLVPGSDIVAAVGGLERILPAADGVYVGGVVIGLIWGKVLARILLAFLYDTSSPEQLAVVGTVSVLLPEQSPLLKLHVDIVGRFSADPFAIDVRAGLRDSELAGLVLTGDAALQLQTGDDARFLLALGGFHPAFTPPDGFPALRRLSLALPSNPLIQLSLTGCGAIRRSRPGSACAACPKMARTMSTSPIHSGLRSTSRS
jgi:hypothetical protein